MIGGPQYPLPTPVQSGVETVSCKLGRCCSGENDSTEARNCRGRQGSANLDQWHSRDQAVDEAIVLRGANQKTNCLVSRGYQLNNF